MQRKMKARWLICLLAMLVVAACSRGAAPAGSSAAGPENPAKSGSPAESPPGTDSIPETQPPAETESGPGVIKPPHTVRPAQPSGPAGTEDAGEEPDLDVLRERYPEYFGLSAEKGLEVYVWQMAEESYFFGLMDGTNREKTNRELWALRGTGAKEMRAILSTYDIDPDDVFIIPWQNPLSSYIAECWIFEQGEGPEALEKKREAHVGRIRAMLFGD